MTASFSTLHRAVGNGQEEGDPRLPHTLAQGPLQLLLVVARLPSLLTGNSVILSRKADGHTLMPDNMTKGFPN